MAELVGTARIRVDIDTGGARQSIQQFSQQVSRQFRDVQDRISRIRVTLDDQTGPGVASVQRAIRGLRDESPVRIEVDGRATQITAAARALRQVANRGAATATSLDAVRDAGRDAARALHDLTGRAIAARAALDDLRGVASRLATALRRVEDRSESVATNFLALGAHTDRLSRQMDDLRDSTRDVGDGLRGLRGNIPSLNTALRGTSNEADGAGGKLGKLLGVLGGAGLAVGGAAAALGGALPAIAGAAAALANLAPAAGVAATGMLALTSAQAAFKIGTLGVEDALKVAFDPEKAEEFNKALKNLSPNARSFVKAIQGAEPAFTKVRKQVQDRLFEGLDKTLERTAKVTAPALKRSLLESAESLNIMGRGVLNTAAGLGKSGALGTALDGANAGLRNLTALPQVLVRGLVQVGAAAAPAFERLTKSGGSALERLSQAMTKGFESGAMERSINRAVGLAKELGRGLADVGRTIRNVLGAADASGAGVIGTFRSLAAEMAKVTAAPAVQSGLRTLFETMGTVGRTAATLLGEAVRGLAPVITALGPPVQTLVRNLGSGLTPVIRSLSPVLTSLATNAGRLVTAFSPLITVAGDLVGGVLSGLEPVLSGLAKQAALLGEGLMAWLGPALSELPALVNPIIETFGALAGTWLSLQNEVLEALMPSLQRMGKAFGTVLRELAPLGRVFADFAQSGLRGFAAAAEPAIEAGGRLAEILTGKLAGAIESVAKWAGAHKLELMTVFNQGQSAAMSFVIAVTEGMPVAFSLFRMLASVALDAFSVLANGAATALGWIPGIGDKIKGAAENFNTFAGVAKKGLGKAQNEINRFSAAAGPKLRAHKLRMDISNWQSQIKEAKRQLSDKNLPAKKRARLLADIKQWERNVATAKRQIGGVKGVARKITVTSNAKAMAGSAQGAIRSVRSASRRISVSTNAHRVAGAARGAIQSVRGRTVNVHVQFTSSGRNALGAAISRVGGATGGLYTGTTFRKRGYQTGGLVDGPGTTTSDSVFAPFLSRGEFVMRAAAVRKYGLGVFEQLNSLRAPAMAAGGAVGAALGGTNGGTGAGRQTVQGFIDGMASMLGALGAGARTIAGAAIKATEDELQISSPSRRFATIGKQVGAGFIKGLTGSKAQIDRTADRIAASITRAFRGTGSRRDNRLVAMIQRENRELQSLAGQRDSVAKKLADAKKFSSDLAGRARGTGSLGSIVREDFFAPQYVEKRMRASLANIKSFTANVAKLQKRGLNKALLRQILEMGPEQGAAFAKSLAGQDTATIKRYNKLQTSISKASSKLGRAGADMLFDSGKKASQGFLTGLKAQQKNIEKLMLSIAKGMQKAIRKALGIKSPSTVMAEVGRQSALGLVTGLAGQIPAVDRTMGDVAAAIATGVGSPRIPGMPATADRLGAGATVVNNYLTIANHGVIGSRREAEDWLAAALDRLARQRRLPAAVGG